MKHLLAVVLIIGFAASIAKADAIFFVERGNWSIGGNTGQQCSANSRPAVEINVSPLMTLSLHYDLQRRAITVEAYFWPDAFEKGEKTTMSLYRSGDVEVKLPATASEHYKILADRALTRQEVWTLGKQHILAVKAEGLPFNLGVQMNPQLGLLERDLLSCAQFVEAE